MSEKHKRGQVVYPCAMAGDAGDYLTIYSSGREIEHDGLVALCIVEDDIEATIYLSPSEAIELAAALITEAKANGA